MPHPFEALQFNKGNLLRLLGSLTTGVVQTFSAGSTGLTPSSPTAGAVTLAGTLNVASGGTGASSLAANGVLIGRGAVSAVVVTSPGTTGTVLTGVTGSAPVFTAISAQAVTTWAGGTTGLTPAAATSGVITLAGTLAVANGGTGVATSTGSTSVVLSASPALTGTPTAPTAAAFNNTTQLATTAYADRTGVQQVVSTVTGAVSTGTTVLPFDDTIPQNNEGDQFMTLSITPKSATTKLVVVVTAIVTNSIATASIAGALFRDSTANAVASSFVLAPFAASGGVITLTYIVTSGSTSSTTFNFRAGGNVASTTTFNGSAAARIFGGTASSSIVITEYGS